MEFDLDTIRANEERLRAKYGKSARDLDKESEYADERFIETADVSAVMKELLEAKKAFNAKKQEAHSLVTRMAGDAFIYYPEGGADNWIEDVEILDYYERISIKTMRQVEADKLHDFCDRTGLKLIDVEVYGRLSNPDVTYIFEFERDDEYNPCEGCCRLIECEDCSHSPYY